MLQTLNVKIVKNSRTMTDGFIIMIINSYSLIVFIFVFFQMANAGFQSANWPLIQQIKSGDHKLLIQQLLLNSSGTTVSIPQSYLSPGTGITYTGSSLPTVAISLRDMKVDRTSNPIDFKVQVTSIDLTKFSTILTIPNNNTFYLLYYMYIAIDPTFPFTQINHYSIPTSPTFNSTNGFSYSYIQSVNQSITGYSTAVLIPFVVSFSMLSVGEYSIGVVGSMNNSNSVILTINSNSTLARVQIILIVVDKTSLEANQRYFIDTIDYISWNNDNVKKTQFNLITTNYYNFITGITAFRINTTEPINFYINAANNAASDFHFLSLRYQGIMWRERQCINASLPYYIASQQRCYDTCPANYGSNTDTVNYYYCQLCHYSCVTCLGDGVTCSSCSSGLNRHANSNSTRCPCLDRFVDVGFAMCIPCDYTCLTCVGNSKYCIDCPSNTRTLTNNSCPCNNSMFDTLQNDIVCQLCHYSCKTCQKISTNCTSCESSNFRTLDTDNLKCPCSSGHADNNTALCISSIICSSLCNSCNQTSNNCTSCAASKKRTLINFNCVCTQGYQSPNGNVVCTQICGDGLLMQNSTECDDGNMVNGDGCSSTCYNETGFLCSNTNRSSPTVCVNNRGYAIALTTLNKDAASNTLTAQIEINPFPPIQSGPFLKNLVDSLQITSYSLQPAVNNGVRVGIMTINMLIKQQVSSSSTLLLGLSVINGETNLKMQTTNMLQIKPYNQTYLNLYKAQYVLVWIYIALLWIGSLFFMIMIDYNMFSGIIQLFIFSALSWIASQGQKQFSLLYSSLSNLRFIFGFNIQIYPKKCLLQVLNIGFLYNILPLLFFFFSILLSKKIPLFLSTKIKRFILYDMSFAWMLINSFLVIYGLSQSVNYFGSTSIQIGSLFVGCVYTIVLLILAYLLFFKQSSIQQINPKMQITKRNMYRPKIIPIYYISLLIIAFVYLSIKTKTNINSLIVIGFLLLMFFIFAFVNLFINKTRYMINIVALVLIYGCVLLINTVPSADWSGFLILVGMYIQLFINFIFMYCERTTVKNESQSELSQTQRKNVKTHQQDSPFDKIQIYQQDAVNQRNSRDQNNSISNYASKFVVYQPTTKKQQFLRDASINISIQNYNSNAIETVMKNNVTDRERVENKMNLKRFLLTSPKTLNNANKDLQMLYDIADREVKMNQI